MFSNPADQRSSLASEVHLEDPEWEGWTLCGERLRPARGETVGLLYAVSAAAATCSTCRSAGKEEGLPRPEDASVHVGVRVRIICASDLEGQTGTVMAADGQQQVITVRVDGDRRPGRGLIRVKLAEVEPVPLARDHR